MRSRRCIRPVVVDYCRWLRWNVQTPDPIKQSVIRSGPDHLNNRIHKISGLPGAVYGAELSTALPATNDRRGGQLIAHHSSCQFKGGQRFLIDAHWWHSADRRVRSVVVEPVDQGGDCAPCNCGAVVGFRVDLVAFDRPPEWLHEDIVTQCATSAPTALATSIDDDADEVFRIEPTALFGVHEFRSSVGHLSHGLVELG